MYKNISYEEIGKHIGKVATEYFGCYYSDNIKDYEEDIKVQYENTYHTSSGKIIEENNCYIELCEVGKAPLIIEWKEYFYFLNEKDYEDMNYYDYEYNIIV